MSTVADHGIILRVRPYRETSVMVHWLTAESGRIATAVRGARGPKSRLQGRLDLFLEADLILRIREGSEVHSLGEVQVTDHHVALRRDFASLAILAHAVETLEQVTESGTPQPEVFEQFLGLVHHLEVSGPRPRAVYAWELRFLATQGLDPGELLVGPGFRQTGGTLHAALLETGWEELGAITAGSAEIRALDRGLASFWTRQFGRLPKSRKPALEAARAAAGGVVEPHPDSGSDGKSADA
jgi:hypothetical protein